MSPQGADGGPAAWPYEVRPDDVYVVSYPRSGNNWMRWMLSLLREPSLDLASIRVNPCTCDPYDQPGRLNEIASPRIVKSHAAHEPRFPRVVYLYRDGRDCLVSWYDFSCRRGLFAGPFGEFVRQSLRGQLGFETWAEHVTGWLTRPPSAPLLAVRYESLLADPETELRRAAVFLGWDFSDATLRGAIHGARREVADLYLERFGNELWTKGVRAGLGEGTGAWRSRFDESLHASFWAQAGLVMESLGYGRSVVGAA